MHIYTLTNQLNNSTEHSPSSEANRSSTSRAIPRILWNLKVHNRIHKKTRFLSLSWATSIQSMPPHPTSPRSIFISSSHFHAWVFQVASFPQVSPPKPCMHLSSPSFTHPHTYLLAVHKSRMPGSPSEQFCMMEPNICAWNVLRVALLVPRTQWFNNSIPSTFSKRPMWRRT